jgi:hypothetical protein
MTAAGPGGQKAGRQAGDDDVREQLDQLRRRTRRLAARVGELEQEMREAARLQRRVAELTDVVGELLVPAMSRDDARVRQLLEHLERIDPPADLPE